jgi:hypothetical protein
MFAAAPTAADAPQEIKIWGRRRLFALARVLPLCDRVEVRLLGNGLPSIWIAHMGEMRLVLALSGWTANDWTSGANLELLAGTAVADAATMSALQTKLHDEQRSTADALAEHVGVARPKALASLHELCKHGQAVYDFANDCYRYREVMPFALSEAVLGPEHPELAEGRRLAKSVKVTREEALAGGRRLYMFKIQEAQSEAVVDADGAFKGAKCSCSFFYKNRLRAGPCRHLVALKLSGALGSMPSAETRSGSGSGSGSGKSAARGPVRREEVISFVKSILGEVTARADADDKGISEVVEGAWDLAFERLQACTSWKDAVKLVDGAQAEVLAGRSVSNPVQQTVMLHEEVLREITLVADRLGASPSATVNLAWLIQKKRRG